VTSVQPSILIVDDEQSVRKTLTVILKKLGNILSASNGDEALSILCASKIDLVLLDVRLPDINGIDLLKKIKKIDPDIVAIMITAVPETKTAVEAMKLNAYDYIIKPFDIDELKAKIRKSLQLKTIIDENKYLRSEFVEGYELIGESPAMKKIFRLIEKAASVSGTVLISGESGTGKELVARAIHFSSSRRTNLFVAVNCAGIPENLLESELFGHEMGAFTGAMERRQGKFETANGGTVFLDEIGSMSISLQAKILRVLQENKSGFKEIERVGSSKPINVDSRVISATNIDLKKLMKNGTFRQDLFYRLNVIPIELPPLRERREDIPLLVDYYLKNFNRILNKKIIDVDDDAMDLIMNYYWPGNIRELKNIVERIVTLKHGGGISVDDLPLEITMKDRSGDAYRLVDMKYLAARDQLDKQFILSALKKSGGNQIKAAKTLGLHRNTLRTKMKQMGIKKRISESTDNGKSDAQ
jgi:DNA-binding NtrC family response regulator